MKRVTALLAIVCLLLCGCSGWRDGYHYSVRPHKVENDQADSDNTHISQYSELLTALTNLVQVGTEHGVLYAANYDQTQLSQDMPKAIRQTMETDPIAAYAVEEIEWQMGMSSGVNAVAVDIHYLHDRSEIRNIRRVANVEEAWKFIAGELDNCASGVVLELDHYEETDFVQLVEDYADENPQSVMEKPQITANLYPESGTARVLELKFTYQTSRESLRNMQSQVTPVFASAALYVSGDGLEREKFSQLYSFLTERYDYQFETSITPAYSLLRHGVGDAKAFATVYAAMCRGANLSCSVVTGTRWGEPWTWNLVEEDGVYYHVDILRCMETGSFREWRGEEMEGYVWDYSAYPQETQPNT